MALPWLFPGETRKTFAPIRDSNFRTWHSIFKPMFLSQIITRRRGSLCSINLHWLFRGHHGVLSRVSEVSAAVRLAPVAPLRPIESSRGSDPRSMRNKRQFTFATFILFWSSLGSQSEDAHHICILVSESIEGPKLSTLLVLKLGRSDRLPDSFFSAGIEVLLSALYPGGIEFDPCPGRTRHFVSCSNAKRFLGS